MSSIANNPIHPVHTIYQDCGIDGNSGPHFTESIQHGMTLRQHYAGLMMQGFIASNTLDFGMGFTYKQAAARSIKAADALIAELEASQ